MARKARTTIKRSLPKIGTTLIGTYKNMHYEAIIVKSSDFPQGRAVLLQDKLYQSLSGAAKALTKNPTNGWIFWKIKKR